MVAERPSSAPGRHYQQYAQSQVLRTEPAMKLGGGQLDADADYLLDLIVVSPQAIQHASTKLLRDKRFLRKAAATNGHILKHLKRFGQDKDIVEIAVVTTPEALAHASTAHRSDPDVVRKAVEVNGLSLKYAKGIVHDDFDIVLVAVEQNGMALRFASHELQSDIEVVRAAVAKDGLALQFASAEMRSNREVAWVAICSNRDAAIFCGDVVTRGNDDKVKKALSQHSLCAREKAQKDSAEAHTPRQTTKPNLAKRIVRPGSAGALTRKAPSTRVEHKQQRPYSAGSLRHVRSPNMYNEWRIAAAIQSDKDGGPAEDKDPEERALGPRATVFQSRPDYSEQGFLKNMEQKFEERAWRGLDALKGGSGIRNYDSDGSTTTSESTSHHTSSVNGSRPASAASRLTSGSHQGKALAIPGAGVGLIDATVKSDPSRPVSAQSRASSAPSRPRSIASRSKDTGSSQVSSHAVASPNWAVMQVDAPGGFSFAPEAWVPNDQAARPTSATRVRPGHQVPSSVASSASTDRPSAAVVVDRLASSPASVGRVIPDDRHVGGDRPQSAVRIPRVGRLSLPVPA